MDRTSVEGSFLIYVRGGAFSSLKEGELSQKLTSR